MPETTEIWVRTVLTTIALLLALWEMRPSRAREENNEDRSEGSEASPASTNRASVSLLVLTLLSVFTYLALGSFRPNRAFVHHWEQFHYSLGSKYFDELGYDGLYLASLHAQIESDPGRPRAGVIRNLEDNHLIGTFVTWQAAAETAARFSPERWQQFTHDHHALIDGMDDTTLHGVRKDHGFNATPTWTFVAQSITRWIPLNDWTLHLLGSLDLLLLGTAGALVWRTFGARTGCWFFILLGLGYPWRFSWMGGSLLRQLWFFSAVASVCALKTRRFATGGGLLAFSAMLRVFPAAFFLGPLIVAIRDSRERRDLRWLKAFLLGTVLTVGLSILAGSMTGRGGDAWSDFGANLEKHRSTWLTNNLGLTVPLLFDVWIQRASLLTPDPMEPGAGWKEALDTAAMQRQGAILLFALTMLFLAGGAAWRSQPDEATLLGPMAAFAIASITSYYWIMLLLLLLFQRPRWPLPALLALNLGACVLHLRGTYLYELYGLGSWALLILFITLGLQIALSKPAADGPAPSPSID